jgi:hypothetical protein
MTQHDRRRAARSNAFRYQEYKAAVNAYIDWALSQTGKQQLGGTAVSSGHRSDPTARAAIKLIDMPEHIRTKALWVRAVNDAWRECREDNKQLAYLFEKNFRLTGDILGPEHNTAVRNSIMEELGISSTTFYEWLESVSDILVYHATKRKLL